MIRGMRSDPTFQQISLIWMVSAPTTIKDLKDNVKPLRSWFKHHTHTTQATSHTHTRNTYTHTNLTTPSLNTSNKNFTTQHNVHAIQMQQKLPQTNHTTFQPDTETRNILLAPRLPRKGLISHLKVVQRHEQPTNKKPPAYRTSNPNNGKSILGTMEHTIQPIHTNTTTRTNHTARRLPIHYHVATRLQKLR